ncbi:MAG: uroporphyrinogen decarboxylase [Planctomycetota bacterium]|nr:uroporphyrinogen decarboxylase [Planctomycetota bacterium]
MTWTSRERVIAAIEHREPDRVPIDINPVPAFYRKLLDYLGLQVDEPINPGFMEEAIPHPRVLAALGGDLISVKLGSAKVARPAPPRAGLVMDDWGVGLERVHQPGGGSYLEPVYHPLAEATLDDLETYPWPDPTLPDRGEAAEVEAKRLYEDTDLALVGRFGGPIVQTAIYLMGFQRWLECVAGEAEFAGALLDKITDIVMVLDRIGLEATAKYLQIYKISGDDVGMQTGPLYSPQTFRSLILPRLRRRWQAARAYLNQVHPAVQIMFHSCGGIRPFIPDLIEIGLHVLDPVQPLAAGMDSAELKRDFGDRLTFHGGVDEQHVLPFGTPAEVAAEVRLRLRAFAPGGGYILAPSHYVQADTPPANIVAMCRAAQRSGQYPIVDCC